MFLRGVNSWEWALTTRSHNWWWTVWEAAKSKNAGSVVRACVRACGIRILLSFFSQRIDYMLIKEALPVLMLCTPVSIFTSGSSALLGRPRCGLSIWLSLLAIFNTLFWVYANFFHKKTDKRRKYSKSAIFASYENDCRRLLGAQSINAESSLRRIISWVSYTELSAWLGDITRYGMHGSGSKNTRISDSTSSEV